MEQYKSEKYKISFDYPAEWQVYESDEIGGVQVLAPATNDPDTYADTLSILVRPQQHVISEDSSVLSYMANEIIKANFESYTKYMLLSLISADLNGIPAKEMTFGYEDPKRKSYMRAIQIVFMKNNNVYLTSYTATEKNSIKHQEIIEHILNSIEIHN